MNKRVYSIGRKGQIKLDDDCVSKQHAELTVSNGEFYLRDCGSANGIYLVKNKRLVPFQEGFVQLHQLVVLGQYMYTISRLLEWAGEENFASTDNTSLEMQYPKPLHMIYPLTMPDAHNSSFTPAG